MPIHALSVLCAQLTCDLFAIAKFLLFIFTWQVLHSTDLNHCTNKHCKFIKIRQCLLAKIAFGDICHTQDRQYWYYAVTNKPRWIYNLLGCGKKTQALYFH